MTVWADERVAQDSREVEEIVTALKAGDEVEENFRRLFLMFHPRLISCFKGWRYDSEVARDLSQDTLIQAFRKIKDFRGDCKLWTWLYTIARHRHLNHLSRVVKKRDELEQPIDKAEAEDNREATTRQALSSEMQYAGVRSQERLQRLRDEVDRLPPRMRQCLLLRVFQGLTYQKIADTLGIAIGTVKSHLHEAREVLRVRLKDEFDDIDF